MPELGPVLEKMTAAHRRAMGLTIAVETRLDARYLDELVGPAMGFSAGMLRSGTRRFGRQPRVAVRPSEVTPLHAVRRLILRSPDDWTYETLDESGSTTSRVWASNGVMRTQDGDAPVHSLTPDHYPPQWRMARTDWRRIVDPVVRGLLDPVKSLAMYEIHQARQADGRFGTVYRLTGVPRDTDWLEAELISAWASHCLLDVHADTGFVMRAVNVRDVDWGIVTHEVVELSL